MAYTIPQLLAARPVALPAADDGFEIGGTTYGSGAPLLQNFPQKVSNFAALKALSVIGVANKVMVHVLGYYAENDGGGGIFYYNSASATADDAGTVIAPNAGPGRWLRVFSEAVNVRWFGAKGDGVNDDSVAIRAALATQRAVFIPAGTYKVSTILDPYSGQVIFGEGDVSVINYVPANPAYDRCFRIEAVSMSGLRTITGAIVKGATSFVSDAPSVADIAPGDWLIIQETDHPVAAIDDICNVDWVRVKSIVGTTVNMENAARVAFAGNHLTYGFKKVNGVVEGVTLRDFKIVTNRVGGNRPIGVNLGTSRGTTLERVTIVSPSDVTTRPVFAYRGADFRISSCRFLGGAPEIAASVDWVLSKCTLGGIATSVSEAISVDMGSAFFRIADCTFTNAQNIGILCIYGPHDGEIVNNSLGWVTSPDANLGNGIEMHGCQNITVSGNALAGGQNNAATNGNVGLFSGPQSMVGLDMPSGGNVFIGNTVGAFLTRASVDTSDVFVDSVSGVLRSKFGGAFVGTSTNDDAAAGIVGEYRETALAAGGALALVNGTPRDVVSVALGAGDWDVSGIIYFAHTAALAYRMARTDRNPGSGFQDDGSSALDPAATDVNTVASLTAPLRRYSLAAPSTIYLTAVAGFAAGTASVYGVLRARRVR